MVKTVFRYSVGNVTFFWYGIYRFQFLEEFGKFQLIACRHSYLNDRQRRLPELSTLEFISVLSTEEAGRNFASRR